MIDKNNIINAVSPLKKRTPSYKGGTKIKKSATGTAKRRAGFAKSTSTTNKAGYNAQTSFKPIKGESAGGKQPASVPSPTKPYQFGPDGKLGPVTNNYITNTNTDSHDTNNTAIVNGSGGGGHWEDQTTTELEELESYDDFWTTRIDSGKHSKGMKTYIKKHGGDLDAARKEWEIVSRKNEGKRNSSRKKTTTTSKVYVPPTSSSNVTINQSGATT